MYKITAKFPSGNSLVIYDPVGSGALPVQDPKQTEELNQPGSLSFVLLYPHNGYGLLEGMKTYISSEKEGQEIFYGRVLDVEQDELTGQETVTCEGALSFLNDGFLAPDPKNSSGVVQSQTMTAEAFFRRCITEYNADIGNDPRRVFTVGTVSHSRKNEERLYQITQFTSAKEAIEQNILNNYGGFLKVYRNGLGDLMIDWVEDYGVVDSGLIELGENVISQGNRLSGENMFTAIRPVGKDGLVHSTTPIIDVYSAEEMAEYGRIVKNVDFPNITNEADLLTAGQALVQRINKTIYISSEISLLDFHFVDEEEPEVNLGNCYTNIAGLEGVPLTVSTRNRDYDNPQNDSVSLRNSKHLEGNGIDDFKNDEGGISKQSSRSSGGVGMALKYYHELQDEATIIAEKVRINGQQIDLAASQITLQGNQIESLSNVTGSLGNRVTGIEGTGVIQNSEAITSVAGHFRIEEGATSSDPDKVVLIEGAKLHVEEDGIYSEVLGANGVQSRINQEASSIRLELGQKATVYYQYSDPTSVPGHTVQDKDIWIQSTKIDSHNEAESFTYTQLGQYNWIEYYGAIIYVRENGAWKEATNQQRAEMLFAENEFTLERVNLIRGDLDSMYSQFMIEKGQIRSIVEDVNNGLKSSITQTASQIRSELTDAKNGLSSSITQTAGQIRSEVADSVNELQSSITQEANRISLVVEGTGSNAHIKPASIVASINAQTGTSKVRISADQIDIDGIVTALNGKLVTVGTLAAGTANVAKLSLESGGDFYVREAGSYWGFGNNLTGPMQYTVIDADASGNVLTLTHLDGTTTTFSKATTLSPTWSGSVLTMSAKQTNGGTETTVASKTLGFGGLVTSHDVELQLTGNGNPTKVANVSNIISCPVKVEQLTTQNPISRYTRDVQFSVAALLQEKSASSNGSVTPDSGYIGLSKVTVNVSVTPSIANSGTDIYTSSSFPSGATNLSRLVSQFNAAKEDGDNLIIRVHAGGVTKTYYCTP